MPWLEIEERGTLGNAVRLRLVFDASAMPERIDHDVVQLELDEYERATIRAHGKR